LAEAARANLARRIGRPIDGALDDTLLDRLPGTNVYGRWPVDTTGTSRWRRRTRISPSQKLACGSRAPIAPDLNVGSCDPPPGSHQRHGGGVHRVDSDPGVQQWSRGDRAGDRAADQADAQRRVTALDIEQAITDAQAQAANAATTARAASGPALAAAQEAARIARIGYREGKFGQLELLDAERTLADTRVAAIDALANYQNARAQVERLTARAPNGGISDEELLSRGRGVARPALGCLRRQGWRKRGNCRRRSCQ
jgi:cobalt-zinc-cadmium efflux system outer membrane protein